ncbi:MAG: outer membrane beta-barrel protein, partial [Candidatus Brocadiales bacterium]|nr:outer membrane beta-barrel protein [Candidatus Bathyanammoxibius sp.]
WIEFESWVPLWNPNFTNSYIDVYGAIGTVTGVGLGYPVTDRFTANYYFINSFDTFVNNNKSFMHGLQLDYNPPDLAFFKDININLDTLWGPDHESNNSDWHQVYNLEFSFSPLDKVVLITNSIIHSEPKGIKQPSGKIKRDNHMWGVAQYLIYDFTDRIGLAFRGEYYWDHDNMGELAGGTAGASLAEVTGTLNLRLRERVMVRPEVRYDKIISVDNGPAHIWQGHNKNVTGLIAVTYEF